MDIVWDRYISDSIKAATREKRGKGIRMKVAGKNKVPGNWSDFLRDEGNFFNFSHKKFPLLTLSSTIAKLETSGVIHAWIKKAAGVRTTSELTKQDRPSPEGWGWSWDDKILSWTPVWTTLPIASKACAELIKCGCKSKNGCGARCGCKKANWSCTELCGCNCMK